MKTIIYIDGQNFLYKVSERLIEANLISDKQDITSLDIRGMLEPLFPNQDLIIKYYGVKRINHPANLNDEMILKANRFSDSLRRLKNYLNKNNVIYVSKGSLKAREIEPCKNCGYHDYKFQEKGVDVGLAIDLVRDVILDGCDKIGLLSSDTDLLPAIQIIKEKGANITYISFAEQATISLVKASNRHVVLSNQDIRDAYVRSFI